MKDSRPYSVQIDAESNRHELRVDQTFVQQ